MSAPIDPQPDADGVIHVDTAAETVATETVDAPEPEQIDDDSPADMRTVRKLRHEAATNRLRAKEAEAKVAELEGAVTRLAELERREVERLAAEQLIDGSDVWSAQPDLHGVLRRRIPAARARQGPRGHGRAHRAETALGQGHNTTAAAEPTAAGGIEGRCPSAVQGARGDLELGTAAQHLGWALAPSPRAWEARRRLGSTPPPWRGVATA